MTKKIILTLLLISILFRGWIFRQLITYTSIGTRASIEITNPKLLDRIQKESSKKTHSLEKIILLARTITNKELGFSSGQVSNNPNELIHTKKANCVGYAAMFNSIANYLIKENKLEQQYASKHRIGRLALLGFNLNQLFDSPFFRDHDFNEIIKLPNSSIILIDPSLSDYLRIDYVR